MVWLLLIIFTACYAQPAPALPDPLHHSGLYPQVAQNVQNGHPSPVGVQLAQQPVILQAPALPAFNHLAFNGQPGLPQFPTFPNQIQQNPQFSMNNFNNIPKPTFPNQIQQNPQFPPNTLQNIPNLSYNLNPALGQNYQSGAQPLLNNGFNGLPQLQMQPAQSAWGLTPGLQGGQQFTPPSHYDIMQRLMNPTAMINNPTMLGAPTFSVGAPLYNQVQYPTLQYPQQVGQQVAQQVPISGYNTAQTQTRPAAPVQVAQPAQLAPPAPVVASTLAPSTPAPSTPAPRTTMQVVTTTERVTEAPVKDESDESWEEVQQSTGVTVPPLQQSASGKIVSARETALQMHLRKAEVTSTVPPAIEVITSTLTAPVTLEYRKSKLTSRIDKINGAKIKKQSKRKQPRKTTIVPTTTEAVPTVAITKEVVATEATTSTIPAAPETTATTAASQDLTTSTAQSFAPKVLDYRNMETIKKLDEVFKSNDKPYTLVERKELSQNGSQVFEGSDGKLYTMNAMTQVKAEATVTEILSRVLDAVLPAQSIKDLMSESDKIVEVNDITASNSLAAKTL